MFDTEYIACQPKSSPHHGQKYFLVRKNIKIILYDAKVSFYFDENLEQFFVDPFGSQTIQKPLKMHGFS